MHAAGPFSTARLLAMAAAWCAFSLASPQAQPLEVAPDEYDVKLAYLYNLARFTYWGNASNAGEFQVCLLGTNPFGDSLRQLSGRRLESQTVSVRQVDEDSWDGCRLLYISTSERQRLPRLLRALAKSPQGVLTVSDLPGFVDRGGMVQLFRDGANVRLALNVEQARQAGLQFKSQLRQLARVPPGAEGP